MAGSFCAHHGYGIYNITRPGIVKLFRPYPYSSPRIRKPSDIPGVFPGGIKFHVFYPGEKRKRCGSSDDCHWHELMDFECGNYLQRMECLFQPLRYALGYERNHLGRTHIQQQIVPYLRWNCGFTFGVDEFAEQGEVYLNHVRSFHTNLSQANIQ